MSEKFHIGRDVINFTDNGARRPISRVTLMLDDETCYTAGDDTGEELVANCVFATQEMANKTLASLKGYVHKAFNAEAANIDPSAEFGDGINVMGVYSTFSEISDDGHGYPDILASGEKRIEEEYPGGSPLMKSFNRKIAKAKATLRVDVDAISAKVEGEGGLEDKFAELKVTLDGVTISDSSGTTKIKGSSIETDTLYVNAANIRGTLTADQIVLSGAITWNSLDSSTQSKITNAETNASGAASAASAAYSTAYQVANGTYQGGSFISGRNIYSPNLYGDTITLLDGSSNRVGAMSLRQGNTNAFDLTSDVSLRLRSAAGYNAYISSGNGPFLLLDGQNQMCYLGGAPLVLDENTFGSSLPSGAIHGQVYFLLS